VSSVVRGGAHVVGIVMGGYSAHRRDAEMMRLLDWTFAQINQQPQLVARATVPWQAVAQTSNPEPIVAGFQFGSSQAPPAQANMQSYAAVGPKGEMDEDSAESRPDDDEIAKIISKAPPKPQVGAVPPPNGNNYAQQQAIAAAKPQQPAAMLSAPGQPKFPTDKQTPPPANVPAVVPMPRDNAVPLALASLQPALPQVTPSPRETVDHSGALEGNLAQAAAALEPIEKKTDKPTSNPWTHGWTIQIGAFGDVPTARAQLAAYAGRATNMLGRAERIIVPFTSADGKTMFRARFGTFAEAEARSICTRLLERGQTCFPATLAR
jgi:D-alanyl-D-alanine carboxypeptidase